MKDHRHHNPQSIMPYAILLFLCLMSTNCSPSYLAPMGVNFSQEYASEKTPCSIKTGTPKGTSRKIVLTFLGLYGNKNCFEALHERLQEQGFECIEASPQSPNKYSIRSNPYAKLDGFYRQKYDTYLGLGPITSQVRATPPCILRGKNGEVVEESDKIVLLGHSQGGLRAVEFWDKFHDQYNIQGIITLATPLQGVAMMKTLSSFKEMYAIAAEQPFCTCKNGFAHCLGFFYSFLLSLV